MMNVFVNRSFDLTLKRSNFAVVRAGALTALVLSLFVLGAGQMTARADTVINNISVGTTPVDVAVNPNGSRVYVSNNGNSTVSVINTSTNTVSTVSDPSGYLTSGGLQEIAVSPDNTRVYVVASNLNYVAVIDVSSLTVVDTITVGSVPFGVAFGSNGKAYVTNFISGTVSEITLNANMLLDSVTATYTVPTGPRGVVAFNVGSAPHVYVACAGGFNNDVEAIDLSTNPPTTTTINVGGGPIHLDVVPGGSKVYVSRSSSNQVSAISTSTDTVVANISSGGGFPLGVAVSATPTGNRVFVANFNVNGFGSYDVGRISASTDTLLGVLTVQSKPRGVAANSAGTRVYVTNTNSNTVSVIDTTI
jgi:YVTN family beta-propeller protein